MRQVVLLLLAIPVPAAAFVSAVDSHATVSPDGTRLLVMIAPATMAQYDRPPPFTLPDGRDLILRETFAKSGVYDAVTLDAIWQVDWYDFPFNLRCSDDVRHVVRLNLRGVHKDWALRFYDDGRLVRTYACSDLLTGLRHDTFLRFTSWNWHRVWHDKFELSEDHRRVELSTARRSFLNGNRRPIDLGWQEFYTFDLASGAIVERRVVGRWRVWVYGAMVLVPLALAPVAPVALRALLRQWKARSRRRGFPIDSPPLPSS